MRNRLDLLGKNIVVYDLEIKKPVDQCVKGWGGHDEMGISVGACYDYRSARYRIFMDDNIHQLVERLNEPGTLVVAFNHIVFDNKLLRGSGYPLLPDEKLKLYDMLMVSKAGCGLSGGARVKGFKLDDHLEVLKLPKKIGEGAEAPIKWQKGLIGEVVDYCLNDVFSERSLFEYMYVRGKCASRYQEQPYDIELPEFAA